VKGLKDDIWEVDSVVMDCRPSKFGEGMAETKQRSAAETMARRSRRDMVVDDERA